MGFFLRKKAGRDIPWPRPRSLSALCSPCVRRGSAPTACVHTRPDTRRTRAETWRTHGGQSLGTRLKRDSKQGRTQGALWLRLQTLSAICPPCLLPTMCPLKPRPCLWTLPALGWCGAGPWHHQAKFFRTIAQPTAFIACPRVSFPHVLFIFGSPNSAFTSAPYA